jgi:uncharacterized membrane protein
MSDFDPPDDTVIGIMFVVILFIFVISMIYSIIVHNASDRCVGAAVCEETQDDNVC